MTTYPEGTTLSYLVDRYGSNTVWRGVSRWMRHRSKYTVSGAAARAREILFSGEDFQISALPLKCIVTRAEIDERTGFSTHFKLPDYRQKVTP